MTGHLMSTNSTIAKAQSVHIRSAQMCPRCQTAMLEKIRELQVRKSARLTSSVRLPFWYCDSCGTKRPRLQD
jgi:uncharacterized protein with PIN domain